MKKHKFIKGLALFVLTLTMLIGLTACPPATPGTGSGTDTNTGSEADITISFDSAKLTCEKKNPVSEKYEAINSGTKVSEGDMLWFKAKVIPTGHIVAEWQINKKTIDESYFSKTCFYTVKKTDTSNDQMSITYINRIPKKAKIEFDVNKIKCFKRPSWPKESLANEAEIKEGESLQFVAIGLEDGKTVKEWTVGSTKEEETIDLFYTVFAKDIKENKLKISYTERNAEKITLEFDKTKISSVIKFNPPLGTFLTNDSVNSGDDVYENAILRFEAIKIPTGTVIDYWTVNGNKKDIGAPWLQNQKAKYVIKKVDASNGKIVISYKTKTVPSYKIIFDATITCLNINIYKNITSGTSINDGTGLFFKAKPPAGKVIDKWMFGSKVIELYEFAQKASKDVANAANEIHVSYTTRDAEKLAITFDKSKVECSYHDNTQDKWIDISNNDKINEGTILRFKAINLASDKLVDIWSIGESSDPIEEENEIRCRISKDIANASNEIHVSYTSKVSDYKKYIGNYSGEYKANDNSFTRKWTGTVDKYGVFIGTIVDYKDTIKVKANLDTTGNITGTTSSSSSKISFSATISDDGIVSGTWKNSTYNLEGSISGSKQP